jgi:elongation factor G
VLEVGPGEEEGLVFESRIKSGALPGEMVSAVNAGVQEAMEVGVIAGFPVTRVKASLLDASFREEESSVMAFKIAGSLAFKSAARKAVPALLEPVMSLVVISPDDYLGDIVGDLNGRRGRIEGMESQAGSRVVKAKVPLVEMFGYATHLRTLTQGRGIFSLEFFAYRQAAAPVMEAIVARIEGKVLH